MPEVVDLKEQYQLQDRLQKRLNLYRGIEMATLGLAAGLEYGAYMFHVNPEIMGAAALPFFLLLGKLQIDQYPINKELKLVRRRISTLNPYSRRQERAR